MPTSKDFSVEDEAYLATIAAEPKMTMDEVGADIEEHGHVPVTSETATQDPFTAKGSLAYALDEALSADTDLEKAIMTRDKNDHLDSHLTNPTDDFRDETKGEVEGTTSTPQGLIQPVESNKVGEGLEPTIQQDKAVQVKDSLAEALDAITMDGAEEIEAKPPIGKDPEPDLSKYNEEEASHIPLKAPNIPPSLGGAEDTPDANGLVYVSATFTVDPDKYVSNNYRPTNMGKMPDAVAELKKASGAMKKQAVNPEDEAAMSDLGTSEAKESAASPDEPTEQQEKEAAKDADKEQAEEEKEEGQPVIPPESKTTKPAQDEAPEKVVLDYATFIDGSSFICFDEVADIDYSKIAMDAGPKKAPTRANCQTTFAQCRAQNPLFCRFHGPKLLEADIKTAIKATVGPGCVVQVTKDKNSKNKFTFRLTVGCPPSKKKMVEKMVHMFLTQNPGITSSTEDWNLVGKHKQTQEFEMDILQADNPPQKNTWADQAKKDTKEAIKNHEKQAVVGETAPALEKKAAKGEKWQTVDEDVENEWADLVDKTVHKSLLGNNEEFLANFNKIANQFDKAHDAGDAAGLKQALESLKDEIGKYDENGEKKPEAATETATSPEAPQEQAQAPQATEPEAQTQAPEKSIYGKPPKFKGTSVKEPSLNSSGVTPEENEQPDDVGGDGGVAEASEGERGESEEVVLPAPPVLSKGNEGEQSTQPAEEADAKKKAAFDKVKKALSGTGYENADLSYDDFGDTQEVYIATSENGEGTLEAAIGKDGGITFGVHDNNGFFGDSDDPKHAIAEFEKNYGGKPPAKSDSGNAISSLQNELSGLMDKMQSIGATTDADVAAMLGHCNLYMDDLKTAKDSLIEIENTIKSNSEDSTTNDLGKSFNMVLLDAAKKQAKEKIDEKIEGMKVAIEQFNESLQSYEKAKIETAKKGVADSVEETIKNLSVSIFGGKRPPQGVDSVVDYLDYLKDELESGAEENITPDEMAGIEDQYHLEDYYKSTKAASKALDDAIQEFKDAMDTNDIEGAKSKAQEIKGIAGMLMGSFGFLKGKLGMIKAEAEEMAKLNKAKERLAKGKGSGASSDSVNDEDSTEDWTSEIHNPTPEFNKKLEEVVTQALGKDNVFGFSGPPSYSSYFDELTITLSKKQPEGYDYEVFGEKAPSKEELDSLKKNLNEVLGSHGLKVMSSKSFKNQGKNVYFDVIAAPKPKSEPKTEQSDFTSSVAEALKGTQFEGVELSSMKSPLVEGEAVVIAQGKGHNLVAAHYDGKVWYGIMKQDGAQFIKEPSLGAAIDYYNKYYVATGADQKAEQAEKGAKIEPFDFAAWEKEQEQEKKKQAGISGAQPPTPKKKAQPQPQSEEPVQQAPSKPKYTDEEKKAKIAAMSPKQKLEAAVKIFKKKLAANPNDADAKAKLAKYEAMLAKLNK